MDSSISAADAAHLRRVDRREQLLAYARSRPAPSPEANASLLAQAGRAGYTPPDDLELVTRYFEGKAARGELNPADASRIFTRAAGIETPRRGSKCVIPKHELAAIQRVVRAAVTGHNRRVLRALRQRLGQAPGFADAADAARHEGRERTPRATPVRTRGSRRNASSSSGGSDPGEPSASPSVEARRKYERERKRAYRARKAREAAQVERTWLEQFDTWWSAKLDAEAETKQLNDYTADGAATPGDADPEAVEEVIALWHRRRILTTLRPSANGAGPKIDSELSSIEVRLSDLDKQLGGLPREMRWCECTPPLVDSDDPDQCFACGGVLPQADLRAGE